ncbi:dihydroneopterin aldolase [Sphingobacterium psychroaquaticum]|uniref:7,8-dihydroneopterin aldolase n=1 Tax=Sphingobacterium psychroaquaticum TaxID=561061 RepID=A0A1X7JMJ8_9SPHI|nr:dihydroneopterin aldolase [Sphingobacterium psychroaquaticum]QBQ40822.1 dihydroneopterin aldolase [Sphingobacterium psychroaquaticum]SMG29096.1 dihydroneopterin aldolase [Sphingobacterium psychroaquaticum]
MGTTTQEVALRDMRFFSPIGFYEEEQLLGNEFFVDLIVSFPFTMVDKEDLGHTLNYEELFALLTAVMRTKRKLLESAAAEILEGVCSRFPFVEQVRVVVRKTTPPFGWDTLNSEVTLCYKK